MTDAIYLDTADLNRLKGLLYYLNESFQSGEHSGALMDLGINIADCNANHLGMICRNDEGIYVYYHGLKAAAAE